MEGEEFDTQPLMELMLTNAMLDCEMQSFKSKIQSRNDENKKLENMITEYRQKISRLEKAIQTSCEREEKVKANIHLLRNSRFITEGLVMSMKHELRISQEKRAETKRSRGKIIQKYTAIFNSYKQVYKNLPWIQQNHELKISIEAGKIHLNVLKLEYASYKKKLSLFHKIGEERMRVGLINLAKMLVERNKLHMEVKEISNQISQAEESIRQLQDKKVKTLEQIDLKVKAAVAEARERATKLKTTSYVETIKQTVASTVASSFSKSNIESIFSRLGIGGPHSLKRPLFSKPSAPPEKVPRIADTSYHLENLNKEHKDFDTYKKRYEIVTSKQPVPESSINSIIVKKERGEKQEKNNIPVKDNAILRASTSVNASLNFNKNESKSLNVSKNENKTLKHHNVDKNANSKENKSPSNVKQNKVIPENTQGNSTTTKDEPKNKLSSPNKASTDDSDKNAGRTEKRKKKLKKKVKKMIVEKPRIEEIVADNNETTFLADNKTKEKEIEQMETNVMPEEVLEPPTSPSVETDQQPLEVMEQSAPMEVPEPSQMIQDMPLNVQRVDMCATDSDAGSDCFNDLEEKYKASANQAIAVANISIDSDSVLSANFNIEPREELMERNLNSPEFFVQRPQGYCFSPPFGPAQTSSPKADKSEKGNKNDFGDSGAMSPFFMMDSSKKTTEGPSSSFTDFFGSMSPKKSDQSTKSFFQLF